MSNQETWRAGGATIVSDSYTRTVSNGWGTADSGGTYATPSSNAADYAVTGGVGQFTIPISNTSRELPLTGAGSGTARDVDVRFRVAANKLPTGTGGEVSFSAFARITVDDSYRGRVRLLADGSVKLQAEEEVAGTLSTIGSSATVAGLTVIANSFIQVHLVVTGANPTTIQMRAWADGASEPTTWPINVTDTANPSVLQVAGGVGFRGLLSSSVTNAPIVTKFADWVVTDLAAGAPTPTPTNTPVVPPTNTPTPTPNPAVVAPPSYDDTFVYDTIGNLTSKDGVSQQYGANNNGTGARPHAARIVGGVTYTYDNNGNLLTGGGRTLTWNAVNQSNQIVGGGVTELYEYDADGSRVKRTVNPSAITTIYAFGLYEKEGTVTRKYYSFAGQPIAIRDSVAGLSYLYGDQIGSVSASTDTNGVLTSMQHFDAWGKKLAGNVTKTKRGFTGQYLDDTGLLFYNARYYDPGIGRFVSADDIAPGKDNPQNRNRYSYGLNNPLKYADPSGHCAEDASERENQRCYDAQHELQTLGLTIVDLWDWQSRHLEWILEAIGDLMRAGGWSVALFKENMGIANGGTIDLIRGGTHPDGTFAETRDKDLLHWNQSITFYDGMFDAGSDKAKFYTVHEFAHAWDNAQGRTLSAGMQDRTGSTGFRRNWPPGSCDYGAACYTPNGNTATAYGSADVMEDWAETVAASVYPYSRFVGNPSPSRVHYAREQLGIPPLPPSQRNAR